MSSSSLAKLRIVAINDVYELTNLPKLQTFLKQLQPKASTVLLAGDFLSPSTLSSIDGGRGMVATLRALGITHCCLGNHESDLHWPQLQNRMEELCAKGHVTLINTNVRKPPPPSMNIPGSEDEKKWWFTSSLAPPFAIVPTACGRVNVALLGLISDEQKMFRDGTFRGAPIGNVISSFQNAYADLTLDKKIADFIVPMTHMSVDRDKDLARTMLQTMQPKSGAAGVIFGGHEHDVFDVKVYGDEKQANTTTILNEVPPYVRILKSGAEAEHATLVDLTFDVSDESHEAPELVDLQADIVSMEPFEPSVVVQTIVDQHMSVIGSLDEEIIVHAETLLPPGTILSSERSRYQQTTVGAVLCKAIKDELDVDVAMINGATMKGGSTYDSDSMSYSALKKELPFPTKMVVVNMKRWELLEAIHYSRRYTEDGEEVGENDDIPRRGYLQVDLDFDAEGVPGGGQGLLEDTLRVALPRNLMGGFCRILPLMDLGDRLKEEGLYPDPDDFVPAIHLIIRHFSKNLWLDIVKESITFEDIDLNGDQVLDREEIKIMMKKFLGHEPPEFVVDDMINAIDADENGVIDAGEFSFLLATMEREDIFRKI